MPFANILPFFQNLSIRISEGQNLLSEMQDAFTKAIERTPIEKQENLRNDMTNARESWDKLSMDLGSVTAQLKAAKTRWDDFNINKQQMEKWLLGIENTLKSSPETKGELSEIKTLLEKYKNIQDEINGKKTEIENLMKESQQLSAWAKKPQITDEIQKLHTRWEKLSDICQSHKNYLDTEMKDYNAYHQLLQDVEKWLLQISFQLMAHNSLYITNRQQTQEQIDQHEVLLNDIQKYQSTLDDLRTKGHSQIDRYVTSAPGIKSTIETQLKNVQDSYNSLLNTSVQIRNRLQESLMKFQEYEDTLASISNKLDIYEPIVTSELDESADSLEAAQEQLEKARDIHNKLQAEKARLAAAVQACEAATASISRPSSPLDVAAHQIPQQELIVRTRLEDLIDQVFLLADYEM